MSSKRSLILGFYLLAFLWGGSFVAIKILIEDFPPWLGASLRIFVALIAMGIWLKTQGAPWRVKWSMQWRLWVAGMFMVGIPFSLLFWGEQKVAAGLAGVLNGTTPLWTATLAVALSRGDRKLGRDLVLGLVIGFIGLFVIFLPRLNFSEHPGEWTGALAIAGMAFCYALSNVINAKLLSHSEAPPIPTSVFHQHLSSWVYLSLLSLIFEKWPPASSWLAPKVSVSVLYLGLASTALAMMIYFHLLKAWGSVRTSVVTYLVPVSALLLDLFVLQNKPDLSSLIGIGLILGSMLLIHGSRVSNP